MSEKFSPFILRNCRKLEAEPLPCSTEVYDLKRQLWIDKNTNAPVIARKAKTSASSFGETTITKTSEGRDQVEGSVSSFGETSLTRSVEGTDQSESGLYFSQFGETTHTAAVEGTDTPKQSVFLAASQFGETTLTETSEGSDKSEVSRSFLRHKALRSDGDFIYIESL